MSYSVVAMPSRRRLAAASNARSLMRCSFSEALRCVAIAAASHTAREPLDEVAGRDHVGAHLPHQLDRARVDARDVGNGAAGGVFHRDAARAAQQPAQPGFELVAAGVPFGRSRQVRERIPLDRVHQPARFAVGGNEVVPAPGREMAALSSRPP